MSVVPLRAEEPMAIPTFEGKEVHSTVVKIVGTIDLDGVVVGMDDIVNIRVETRCINVAHAVDARGDLKRVQTVKVLEATVVPFVEGQDNGIFRG